MVERRDSVGVEIVEVRPSTWPPAEIWQVHDSPTVEIGVTAGDPNYELYGVEGVVTNHLGEIVVAEQDATLRFYGRDGKHLRTYEREGEGPGEAVGFSYMSGYRGDSLLLTTLQGRGRTIHYRLLMLDGQGQFGRDLDVWLPGSGERNDHTAWATAFADLDQAALADGSIVVRGALQIPLDQADDGVVPGIAALMRSGSNGELLDTVDLRQVSSFAHQPLQRSGWGPLLLSADAPPPRARGNQIFWTPGDRFLVNVYEVSSSGSGTETAGARLRSSFRFLVPLAPVTQGSRGDYMDIVVPAYAGDDPPAEKQEYRDHMNALRSPDSLPAIQDIRLDSQGNVWLELFTIPGKAVRDFARGKGISVSKDRPIWVVLDSEGNLLGSVRVPADLEVREIGPDYILGISNDGFGAHQVLRYPIRK